jgi:hypothetical protein
MGETAACGSAHAKRFEVDLPQIFDRAAVLPQPGGRRLPSPIPAARKDNTVLASVRAGQREGRSPNRAAVLGRAKRRHEARRLHPSHGRESERLLPQARRKAQASPPGQEGGGEEFPVRNGRAGQGEGGRLGLWTRTCPPDGRSRGRSA